MVLDNKYYCLKKYLNVVEFDLPLSVQTLHSVTCCFRTILSLRWEGSNAEFPNPLLGHPTRSACLF